MSLKRAFSDEGPNSPDRYSDDFYSDDEKKTSHQKRDFTPKKNSSFPEKANFHGRGSGSLRAQAQGRTLRKGRGFSGSSEPDMKRHSETITTRVLSASRNRINELRNKVEEQKIKIRELEQENKLYKTMQFRQEKTIRTFSDKENDLPMLLDKHNNEIRALKEQNRRLKEKYEKSDRYLRDAEDELEKMKKKMNKYKEICEEKELLERDELSRRLAKVEPEMEEKETKIKELQKHIELLKKSHRHEMGIEIARMKEVKKQVEELKEKNSQLENQLKEKERALDYQNIHSNLRQGKTSRTNSPENNLTKKSKRKAASLTELAPKDKAKHYSEKQRTELHKQKEELQKDDQRMEDELIRKERERKKEEKRREDEEHLEDESRLRDERERKEQREIEEKMALEKKKAEEERRHQLQKEKLENDPVFLAERKKKEELLKKLKDLDETGKTASDPFIRKKNKDQKSEFEDSLEFSVPRPPNSLQASKPLQESSNKLILERQRNIRQMPDAFGYQPSFGPTRETYQKPGNKPPSAYDDDDEPAFRITNNTSSKTTKQEDKKTSLLESLFGPQASSSKITSTKNLDNKDTFSTSKTPSLNSQIATGTIDSFLEDSKINSTKVNRSTFYSDKKSAIFGGGDSLIDDDLLNGRDKVSSYRQRQLNSKTFSAKCSGTDNFDNEIEEVVL